MPCFPQQAKRCVTKRTQGPNNLPYIIWQITGLER